MHTIKGRGCVKADESTNSVRTE